MDAWRETAADVTREAADRRQRRGTRETMEGESERERDVERMEDLNCSRGSRGHLYPPRSQQLRDDSG